MIQGLVKRKMRSEDRLEEYEDLRIGWENRRSKDRLGEFRDPRIGWKNMKI